MNKLFLWAYWICFENLCQVVIKSLVLYLGCVCFGWKSLPEMLFQKWGCFVGLENSIFRKMKSVDKKKKAFDHGNHFTLLFSLQSISGKWERERERTRDRDLQSAPIVISPANIPVVVDRNLATRSRSRSHLREIAPDRDRCRRDLAFERSHRIEIAVDASRDRAVNRDLAKKARSWSRSWIAIDGAVVGRRDLGCGLCFSGFVFSFFFSKHQKIFFGKFFEMQPNTMETFSFSGK